MEERREKDERQGGGEGGAEVKELRWKKGRERTKGKGEEREGRKRRN